MHGNTFTNKDRTVSTIAVLLFDYPKSCRLPTSASVRAFTPYPVRRVLARKIDGLIFAPALDTAKHPLVSNRAVQFPRLASECLFAHLACFHERINPFVIRLTEAYRRTGIVFRRSPYLVHVGNPVGSQTSARAILLVTMGRPNFDTLAASLAVNRNLIFFSQLSAMRFIASKGTKLLSLYMRVKLLVAVLTSIFILTLLVHCRIIPYFGGSGTTAKVAIELGRKAILCELNPEYVKLIEQRATTTIGFAFD